MDVDDGGKDVLEGCGGGGELRREEGSVCSPCHDYGLDVAVLLHS